MSTSSRTILPSGMPVRPDDDLGDRAAVDDGVHERRFALKRRRVRRATAFARTSCRCRRRRALAAGLLDRRRASRGSSSTSACLLLPSCSSSASACASATSLRVLEVGERAPGCRPTRGPSRSRKSISTVEVLDLADGVLERRRRRGLAERDAGAHGVEQAHRLVGQLAVGDVARARGARRRSTASSRMRTLWCFSSIGDEPAEHADRLLLVGLVDLDRLEAALQGGVGLEVLLVLGERRGRDRCAVRRGPAPA